MASDWRAVLRQEPEAYQAFIAYIETLERAATVAMEDAASWEAVLEARGSKKTLARIATSMTMADKEAVAYARIYGPTRATKSA